MVNEPEILSLQTRSVVGKLQILSSAGEVFNHVDNGGPMWVGEGDREVRLPIIFLTPFSTLPQVIVALTGLDSAQDFNLRLNILAEDVTVTGFTLVARTWSDTHIARASASWQASGAL